MSYLILSRQFIASHTLRLSPVAKSIEEFHEIADDHHRRRQVGEIIIQTFPKADWVPPQYGYDKEFDPYHEWRAPQSWFDAISRIHLFPNVSSMGLYFTNMATSPNLPDPELGMFMDKDVPEDVEKRQEILEAVYHAMARCNTDHETKIQSLTIKNLQNYSFQIDDVLLSNALGELEELHVLVATEHCHYKEKYSEAPDLLAFWPYFTEKYLKPLANQLQVLSLYCDDSWGCFPSTDCFKDLHFERLVGLWLGRHVFAYDWQLEWILAHRNLRTLALHQCAIACFMYLDPDFSPYRLLNHDGLDRLAPQDQTYDFDVLSYSRRWTDYFKRLEALPLADFRFGTVQPDEFWPDAQTGEEFDNRALLAQKLSRFRFTAFHSDSWREPIGSFRIQNGKDMWDLAFHPVEESCRVKVPRPLQDAESLLEEKEAFEHLCAVVSARNAS